MADTGEHLVQSGLIIPDFDRHLAESPNGIKAMASWFLKLLGDNGVEIAGLEVPSRMQTLGIRLGSSELTEVSYIFDDKNQYVVQDPKGRGSQNKAGYDCIYLTNKKWPGLITQKMHISAPRIYTSGQVFSQLIDDSPTVYLDGHGEGRMEGIILPNKKSHGYTESDENLALDVTRKFIKNISAPSAVVFSPQEVVDRTFAERQKRARANLQQLREASQGHLLAFDLVKTYSPDEPPICTFFVTADRDPNEAISVEIAYDENTASIYGFDSIVAIPIAPEDAAARASQLEASLPSS